MKRPIIDFKKLIYSKRFLITISVMISIVIWFVAMIVRNPIREQLFNDVPISVSVDNTSAQSLGLGIVSDISSSKFTVKLSGPNYIVSSLKNTDFILSASVAEINAPGTYSLNVTGSRNSDISGYQFVSIEPSKIDVTFDYIDTKVYSVTPKIVGISASDGLVAEDPIISNKDQNEITIKGPRELIKRIDSVGSITELTKSVVLSSTETYDSDIVLFDANGNIMYRYDQSGNIFDGNGNKIESNALNLSFTSIKVTQPISKKATLDVKVNFNNFPLGLSRDKLSPTVSNKRVVVIGTPEVIDKMKEVDLSPIDFYDISTANSEFEVEANLPDGVKFAENIDKFKVKLNMQDFAQRTFNISDIKYRGLSNDLSAKSTTIKNVKVCGPKDVIAKLTIGDLYADIDLSGKTAGEHTLNVQIKSSKYNNIWQTGKYTSSVTIINK